MLVKADTKVCTKCKTEKILTEFYNNRTHKTGKTFWCKVCSNHQSNHVQKESKARWAARTYLNLRPNYPEKLLWKRAWKRAKDERMEFSITVEDITIPKRCPYLGMVLSMGSKDTAPSLDRINSSKGYIKGNIQIISWRANRMKSDASEETLITFAKGVLEVHSKAGTGCAH